VPIVLATKLYQPMRLGPNDRHPSAYHIRRASEASLRRLQTDHIDLYQMHHVDRRTLWEEIWQAMEQLVREGKMTYVGSSNFAGWTSPPRRVGPPRGTSLVWPRSRASTTSARAPSSWRSSWPAGTMAWASWSPIGMGLRGSALGPATEGRRASELLQMRITQHRPQLEQYEALCEQLGEAPAVVALAGLLHNPVVTASIGGPRTVEQLTGSLRALDISLPEETQRRLDEV
jgi:aryl-alcohol dehydrogenase-like predicted oxidoreductase